MTSTFDQKMHLYIIITLIALCGFASAAADKKSQAYKKAMSLTMSYDSKEQGILTVTLTNISDSKLDLMLNTKEVEGEFKRDGSKEKGDSFYDKDYLRKLLTSQWTSGFCELEPQKNVTWTVKLDELVYFSTDRKPVTHASLAGKTFSLTLDRLAVFPAPNESNEYVDLRSNTVTIPKIEQGGADQPATAPESRPEDNQKPKPESKGRSQ